MSADGQYDRGEIPEETRVYLDRHQKTMWPWFTGIIIRITEKIQPKLRNHHKISQDIAFAGGAWKWIGLRPQPFQSPRRSWNIKACRANQIKEVIVTGWGTMVVKQPSSILPKFTNLGRTQLLQWFRALSAHFKTNTGLSVEDFMQLDLCTCQTHRQSQWD